jgi:hypothetical protein
MHSLYFRPAAAAVLTGLLVLAASTSSQARHRHVRHVAVVAVAPEPGVPVVVVAPACGYYSRICNPRFGDRPEIDYSTALSFMIFPQSD